MSLSLRNYSKNNRRKVKSKNTSLASSRRTGTNRVSIPMMSQLFPDMLRTKMSNKVLLNFAANAGATTAWGISANSLHLPQAAIAGVSGANALAFNNATTIVGLGQLLGAGGVATTYAYSGYRIYGASIRFKVQSAVNTSPGTLNCFPTNQGAGLGNVNAYAEVTQLEYPYAKNVRVGLITENQGVELYNSATTCKMFGLNSESTIETSQYSAQGNTSPSQLWQFIVVWSPDTANNSPIALLTEIIYDVEFYQKSLQQAVTV